MYHLAIAGASAITVVHEFEANLSYTVKYCINSIKQANKQLQVDIFS